MLSCILSDTLEFRSPTTTGQDRDLAEKLAADLGIDIPDYAAEMFAAKSDVAAFSDAELLRMDSKEYEVGGTNSASRCWKPPRPAGPGPQGRAGAGDAGRSRKRTAPTRCCSSSSTS